MDVLVVYMNDMDDTTDILLTLTMAVAAAAITLFITLNVVDRAHNLELRKMVDAGIGYYEVDKYGKSTFKYFANTNYVVSW